MYNHLYFIISPCPFSKYRIFFVLVFNWVMVFANTWSTEKNRVFCNGRAFQTTGALHLSSDQLCIQDVNFDYKNGRSALQLGCWYAPGANALLLSGGYFPLTRIFESFSSLSATHLMIWCIALLIIWNLVYFVNDRLFSWSLIAAQIIHK